MVMKKVLLLLFGEYKMKRIINLVIVAVLLASLAPNAVKAAGTRGSISGKTVVSGLLSLLIWPGIGQAVNEDKGGKVTTHALIGLFPPFRFWSGYDALYDRQGGYWKGRI